MKRMPTKPSALMMSIALICATYESASAAPAGPLSQEVILEDATIEVEGKNKPGVLVDGDGDSLRISRSSISSNGQGSSGVDVRGANASVRISDSQIRTAGKYYSPGMELRGAGTTGHISASTITTYGKYSPGLTVLWGANMEADTLTIRTSGDFSNAVDLRGSGRLELKNSDIRTSSIYTTEGGPAHGIFLIGGADDTEIARANISDSRIATNGGYAIGMFVDRRSSAALNNTSISTKGKYAHGIYATGEKSTLGAHDAVIETRGDRAVGAVAQSGATISLTGGGITTGGEDAYGLYTSDGASINAENLGIDFSGDSVGAIAVRKSQISLQNVRIQGSNGGVGLVSNSGSTVSAENTRIEVSGSNAQGMLLANGGAIALRHSEVAAHGMNSQGLQSLASGGVSNTAALTDTTLISDQGSALTVQGGSLQLDVSNTVISGPRLLTVEQRQLSDGSTIASETVAINASRSQLSGDICIDALNAQLKLERKSRLDGAITGLDVLTLDDSHWSMAGSSDVSDLRLQHGKVSFAHGAGFSTLKVNRLAGVNGTLVMNTHLGGDNSASDRLVIDGGRASGATGLIIHNVGGAGAQTQNGILLVEAVNGGATDAAAFKLAQGVRAGAYDYRLFRGGLAAGEVDNWYLHSTFDDAGASVDIDAGGRVNIYGPELSTYGSVVPTAARLGQTTLSTLHERAGAAESLRATDGRAINGAWGRMLLQTYKDQYASVVAPSASAKIAGFQIGADMYRHQQGDGQRDHAGAYLAIANANADVTGIMTNAAATGYERRRTGNIQLDAVSGGGYWSQFGSTGWYTDAIVQATSYSGRASTDRASIGIQGIGAMASLEGGYPFWLGHAFSLEPQAQVLYQRVALNNSADRYSTIGLGASNSVLGRVGVRLQHTSKNGDKFMQPYLRANLWSTLAGAGNAVDYAGVDSIATRAGGNWTQVGVGVTAKIDKNVHFFADLDGTFNVNTRQRRTGVQAAAGMRVNW